MNPGIYDLGDSAIGAAVTNEVITRATSGAGVAEEFIGDLEGASGVALQCNFTYGSGGTTVKVDIETSLDQDFSWIPIARFAFTTSSAQRIMNISANTPRLVPYTPISLSDDTAVDGMLGDRLRAKLTSTGTYAGNTSISVRAVVR
jgi:hypothetical protein